MQQEKLDARVCRVKTCPAEPKKGCIFGYCPVHSWVANDPAVQDMGRNGKLNSVLKEFALDIGRGIYPGKC